MAGISVWYLAAGALVVAGILMGFLRPKRQRPDYQKVECACGWRGEVSRLAGRCPKCNRALGQRLSDPRPRR